MIDKLYNIGCFDYKKFIFDNAKMLSINSDQILVLIYMLDHYKETNRFKIESLTSVLPLTKLKVENALSTLLERNFYEIIIEYNEGIGEEVYSLSAFFDKCESLLEHNKINEKDELIKINDYLRKALKRVLTANEIEIITCLVKEDKYTFDDVKVAVDNIVNKKKVLSMKSLTSELSNQEKKEELKTTQAPQVLKDFLASIK